MVSAPLPGSYADETGSRSFLRIRIKDRELDLVTDLTMKERFVIRASTGMSLESFLPNEAEVGFGLDSLFILTWLAERQNGRPRLSLVDFEVEWPEGLGEDDVDLTEIDLDDETPGDDSPES